MAKLGDKTDFSYRVKKVTKVVDGDTIDVILDMGFNILFEQREPRKLSTKSPL